MPSLQHLLKRCDNHSQYHIESEVLLLQQLGWSGDDADKDVPAAALERLAAGQDSEGFWFRADPVNLQEDQNYLMMSYPSILDLELAEAQAMAESINRHFAEDGWFLEIADTQRWYLRLDNAPTIHTTPAWRAVGKDVFALMPTGEDSKRWHAWLMELQMLLFNHPVNIARTEKGLATVSGLWFWGGGELPLLSGKATSGKTILRGDSPFLLGASRRSGHANEDLPGEMSQICHDDETDSEELILLEHARMALQSGSMEKGMAALQQLEKEIFQPIAGLLKSKKLHSLTLVDSPGHVVIISAGGMRKWWRRSKLELD